MRSITVFVFACACALASGYYMTKDVKYMDSTLMLKQKAMLEVLQHVHQREVFSKLYDESKQYKLMSDFYSLPKAYEEFMHFYKLGMLDQHKVFSIMNEEHREQAIALFHLFYYAKDWDSFYKTMLWARFHMNEGMFIYALTVSVLHRKDMAGIVLPAPYEIYPYYFFNSEVIQKAQNYKMQGFYGMKKIEETYTVIIPANYSGSYLHTNMEQRLSYFTEDIGLNSYYYYFHADYPFWMGGEEYGLFKDRRGEFFFYQYQQLLARYHMERLSNDLGSIPEFSWYEPIKTGYSPALRYYNGDFFPSRDNYHIVYHEHNYYDIDIIEDYERRLRDAIDSGFIILPDGSHMDLRKPESIEYLGNLFQSNPDSKNNRFYGYLEVFTKILLGDGFEQLMDHKLMPSALEHFETAMRDPLFYQLYKRLIKYYYSFKNHLPEYQLDDIMYSGVKIESVEIDKLVTYFESFDADITNAVDIELMEDKTKMTPLMKFGRMAYHHGEDFLIKARQIRLNHLPFTFKLHVSSDKAQKSIVKVFIGPKFDEFGHVLSYDENRENFFELDHFMYNMVAGQNEIVRNSDDFSWFVRDRTTYFELYKQLMLSIKGDSKFPMDMSEAHCGFPSRLMLPKGKRGGMPFQFFFMVMPFMPAPVERSMGYDMSISCGVGSGARYLDKLPFGYPFDRQINEKIWPTPNMFYHDVSIFLKKEVDLNTAH